MPEPLEARVVDPKAFSDSVKNFKIGNYLQDYPRPSLSAQGIPVKLEHSLPPDPTPEKAEGIPYSVILPVTNTFVHGDRAFTEPAIGFGLSAPIPEKYIGIKGTGVFGIVSNNLNGASTAVFGAGWVPFHPKIGSFQGNLGVSAEMVCVEHGDRSKIAPNPGIGTCGLFGSIYSSVVYTPEDKDSFLKNTGFQAIVTPKLPGNNRQDNVFTLGFFRRF